MFMVIGSFVPFFMSPGRMCLSYESLNKKLCNRASGSVVSVDPESRGGSIAWILCLEASTYLHRQDAQ